MASQFRISEDEWENRQLCSDGNCIGVIGPDGRCKECGRPGGQIPVNRDPADVEDPAGDALADQDEDLEGPGGQDRTEPSDPASDEDEWAQRRLCPDGNCIGVIGPDGRCKECGRPAP